MEFSFLYENEAVVLVVAIKSDPRGENQYNENCKLETLTGEKWTPLEFSDWS